MNKISLILTSILFIAGSSSCHHSEDSHAAHNHSHAGHNHAGHNHGHGEAEEEEGVIHLSPASAGRLGVQTGKAEVKPFSDVIRTAGRVMRSAESNGSVSAPTSGILTLNKGLTVGSRVSAGQIIGSIKAENVSGGDLNRAAAIEINSAQREYNRVKQLYDQHLATARELNEAQAALDRARAAYSPQAASGKIKVPVSGVITACQANTGDFVSTGAPILSISSATRLTVEADVPVRNYSSVAAAHDARIVVPATGETFIVSALGGHRLDTQLTSENAGGFIPVAFSINNNGRLLPGTVVEVYLMGGSARSALTVPKSALIEQQGSYFIFEQIDDDCYRRLPVRTGADNGLDVEILSGLKPGTRIVTSGAIAIKLAEAGKNVPEGHSHNH